MKVSQFSVIATTVALSFFALSVKAQEYKTAVGLRLGGYNGISVKHFLNEKAAIEVYGTWKSYSTYSSFFTVTGLYQIHTNFPNAEGLKYYYGGGLSVGIYSYDSNYYGTTTGTTNFGIAGVVGLEYTFKNTPICLSIDWSPTYYFSNSLLGFTSGYAALTGRYYFGSK